MGLGLPTYLFLNFNLFMVSRRVKFVGKRQVKRMASIKRKTLSIREKVEIIRELENGVKNSVICNKFSLASSTVSTLWKNRKTTLAAFENNLSDAKKLKKCVKDDIDKALIVWFKNQRSAGLPINGPILKAQAEKFAKQLGYKDFTCNNGWIDRFKNRNNIIYGKINGEAKSVDIKITDEWLASVWPDLRRKFKDNDIYNADEAGVFFNLTPDTTLKFKNEKCIGGKMLKNRLTVLICANMTGTDKKKLLVIGKSRNPRCFKNVKSLPVEYTANKKAWMTSTIFEEEIRKWDNKLRRSNRKILLLVDNCPAHPELPNLTNITLVFLPANATSVLQPMDQGIIRSFKNYYRRLLVLQLIDRMEKKQDTKISVLDAIRIMSDAWNNVTPTTIQNCYKKAALVSALNGSFEEEDNLPLSTWLESRDINNFQNCASIDEYVDIDADVVTSGLKTDDDILQEVTEKTTDSDVDDDVDGNECHELTPVRLVEADDALTLLTRFFEENASSEHIFTSISVLRRNINELKFKPKVQLKINEMFKNSDNS